MNEGRPLIDVLFPDEPPMTVRDTSDLSRRLKALLVRQGFTVSELARQSGMQKQQTWLICTGRVANPGVETVRRLVEAMGCTLGELFADETED